MSTLIGLKPSIKTIAAVHNQCLRWVITRTPLRRPHFRFRQLRTSLPHWVGPPCAKGLNRSRGRSLWQAAEFQTVAHGGGLLKMRDYGPHSTQKHPHDRRRNVLVASADDGGHDDQKLRRSEGLQARPTKA